MTWIHVVIAASVLTVAGCELPERSSPLGGPAGEVQMPAETGRFRADASRDLDALQQRLERLRAEGSERVDAAATDIEHEIGELRSALTEARDDAPADRRESREKFRQQIDRLEERVEALERGGTTEEPPRAL